MTHAYHRARIAASNGPLMGGLTSAVKLDGDPHGAHLAPTRQAVARPLEYFAAQFNFIETVDELAAFGEDGRYAFTGFEVTHERFGKMLSVDARGGMTLHDEDGTAYSRKAYDAARPDGLIPELANDIIRTERRIVETKEDMARIDDPKKLAV